jgi:hypothetical protein
MLLRLAYLGITNALRCCDCCPATVCGAKTCFAWW